MPCERGKGIERRTDQLGAFFSPLSRCSFPFPSDTSVITHSLQSRRNKRHTSRAKVDGGLKDDPRFIFFILFSFHGVLSRIDHPSLQGTGQADKHTSVREETGQDRP